MNNIEFSKKYSSEFLFNIIENMQDMVRIVNQDKQIVYMNKIMREKFGKKLEKKCFELIGKSEKCRECISYKSIKTGENFKKIEDVDKYTFSILSSPVYDSKSKEFLAVEVFRDMTEEKKLEKQKLLHYEKMKKDLDLAKKIQRRVLPNNSIYGNSIQLASIYEPSEQLGGDIFDVIELDENRVGFYIADVSGHGITASLFTMFLRQTMKSKETKKWSIMETLDNLIENYKDIDIDKDKYFSFLYGIYHKKDRTVTFANAGHNCLPILFRKDKIEVIKITGMPICSILDKADHDTITVQVEKGDKILLYTDGITEAYSPETATFYEFEKLEALIKNNLDMDNDALLNKIYKEVTTFSDPEDDIALLLLEIL